MQTIGALARYTILGGLAWVTALGAAGCGGHVDNNGGNLQGATTGATSGSSTTGGATTGASATNGATTGVGGITTASGSTGTSPGAACGHQAPAACGLPTQGEVTADDAGAPLYEGDWLLCNWPSIFGTSDEVGLHIDADGTWAKLYAAPDGTLQRATGFEKTGTWYTGAYSAIGLDMPGLGTVYAYAAFTVSPREMHLDNNGVYIATYVAIDANAKAPPPAQACPADDAGLGADAASFQPPAECSVSEQGMQTASDQSTFRQLLVGSWMLCSVPSAFGTSDEVGIRINADGTWENIYATANGSPTLGTGFGRTGTWEFANATSYQVDFNIFGSGGIATFPAFSVSPRKMLLDNNGVFHSTYVWTAWTPPADAGARD